MEVDKDLKVDPICLLVGEGRSHSIGKKTNCITNMRCEVYFPDLAQFAI
jgi:hypothetical protein